MLRENDSIGLYTGHINKRQLVKNFELFECLLYVHVDL